MIQSSPVESPPSVEALWRESSARLRGWFARRTGNPALADDLVQETFLRIHARLGSLREDERLDAWLGAIARHVLADAFRARAEPTQPLLDVPAHADAEEPFARTVAGWLEAYLEELDPGDAALLRRIDLEGRRQRELAAELGLSESGTRSRVQRARARLRERLEACCAFAFDARGGLRSARRRATPPDAGEGCQACD